MSFSRLVHHFFRWGQAATRRSAAPAPTMQRGMALIVVLWMLAALSLFAASLGTLVRDQAQQALVQRNLVQGQAIGEAAMYLALEKIQQENRRPVAETLAIAFAHHTVQIHFQPWAGLVNINQAPAPTWKALLQGAAGLSAQQAGALAQTIVSTREQMRQEQARAFSQPWEAVQDILQVPGLGYGTYIQLQPYLVASEKNTRTVGQNAAPPELLRWLQAQAPEQIHASVDNDGLYTLEASVPFPDGMVRVKRHLAWQKHPATGLPWVLLASTAAWHPQ